MSSKRLIAATISIVAIVGIAYVAATGYPPKEPAASGTVGAAQRYQAPQVGATDVQVADPQIQEFLQSETFDRLSKDKVLQAAFANAEVRETLAKPE